MRNPCSPSRKDGPLSLPTDGFDVPWSTRNKFNKFNKSKADNGTMYSINFALAANTVIGLMNDGAKPRECRNISPP